MGESERVLSVLEIRALCSTVLKVHDQGASGNSWGNACVSALEVQALGVVPIEPPRSEMDELLKCVAKYSDADKAKARRKLQTLLKEPGTSVTGKITREERVKRDKARKRALAAKRRNRR